MGLKPSPAPSSWHLSASLCFGPEPIVVNGGKRTPINGPNITVSNSGHNSNILTQHHGLLLYALCFTASFYWNWNTHCKSQMFWTLLKWMRSVQNLLHDLLCSYFVYIVWYFVCLICVQQIMPRTKWSCCSTRPPLSGWPMTTRYFVGKQGVLLFKQYACQPWMKAPPVSGWFTYYLFMR